MRHLSAQLPLAAPWIDHPHARDLAAMSAVLDDQPALSQLVQQDLEAACPKDPRRGRAGLNGEQVLRVLLLRQLMGWSYEALAFHLLDSATYRTFCRMSPAEAPPRRSALQEAISRVQPATLARLNDLLVRSPAARVVESAMTVRMDSTVVPVAIHAPSDSALLLDGVRVFQRLLRRAETEAGFTAYHRHHRRAKRRAIEILHLAPQATRRRRACYRELLRYTEATLAYAACAVEHLDEVGRTAGLTERQSKLRAQLATFLPRVAQVMDQTRRRVLEGEAVPASEKVVSIFEPHADVLVKDRRETYYGHKIYLTTGRSGLILDCAIPKGNPADSTWTVPLVERQERLFGCAPRQTSFDGAFASKGNLAEVKAMGVGDVCFAKKRGLHVLDMVRSQWVYDKLRRFRAGIESGISLLKRVFGLALCVWKGAVGFHSYVRTAVLAANLLLLARHRLDHRPT